ncbi:MAG: bacillithiol system redox-active protein YtxJ [Cyclobacteriaceae bacterium]
MHWRSIQNREELTRALEKSLSAPVLLFKHSTRCAISSMAFDRLDRYWDEEEMQQTEGYLIDVIRNRDLSNYIQEHFSIRHESPQILLIRDGKVIFHDSHMGIAYDSLRSALPG